MIINFPMGWIGHCILVWHKVTGFADKFWIVYRNAQSHTWIKKLRSISVCLSELLEFFWVVLILLIECVLWWALDYFEWICFQYRQWKSVSAKMSVMLLLHLVNQVLISSPQEDRSGCWMTSAPVDHSLQNATYSHQSQMAAQIPYQNRWVPV